MEYSTSTETEDKDLKAVGLELMFLTPEKCSAEQGITAVELSKRTGISVDIVKKKLNILKEKNIVIVKGSNPKYWSFNQYNFQRMPEDDDLFLLLCSFDDVDFDKYFSY